MEPKIENSKEEEFYNNASRLAQELYRNAVITAKNGNLRKAINYCKQCLQEYPEGLLPQEQLYYLYIGLKEYENAIEWLDNILMIDPNDEVSLGNKAMCLKKLNKYDEALEILDKLIEKDPNNPDTLTLRGNIYCAINKIDLGLKHYQKAVEINPAYSLAWQNWTMTLEQEGRQTELREVTMKMMEAVKNHPEMYGIQQITVKALETDGIVFFSIGSVDMTFGEMMEKTSFFTQILEIPYQLVKMFPYQRQMIVTIGDNTKILKKFYKKFKIEPIELGLRR